MKDTILTRWLVFCCLTAALFMPNTAGQDFTFGNYEVVSSKRLTRTDFEYELRVRCNNNFADALGVSATVYSTSENTIILENKVEFGDIPQGGSAVSIDTFKIRQNRVTQFNPAALQWFPVAESMPLTLTIVSPESGILTKEEKVIITGTVGPAVQSVKAGAVQGTLDGTDFTIEFPLEEGRNSIRVIASNSYGGAGEGTVVVTRDTSAPNLNIEAPANGAVVSSRQLTVQGLVNDSVPGTVNPEQATVTVNGLSAAVANRSYAISDVLLVPGKNQIHVVARDRAGNESEKIVEVTFQDPANQKKLVQLAGDGQSGAVRSTLAVPLVVELVDGNGVADTNQPVTFTVTRNDGTLVAAPDSGRTLTLLTDDNGQAQVLYQLGSRSGVANNQVTVTTPGVLSQVIFTASGTSTPPAKVTALLPETQVGEVNKPLAFPWTAMVTDEGGNPVEGVEVQFMAFLGEGGNFEGQTTVSRTTDSDGRASAVMTLGPGAGINNYTALAMVPGLTGSSAVFTASGHAPAPSAPTRILGLVLDHANRPMENILITLLGTTLITVTDEQGQFVLEDVPPGAARLLADARDRGHVGEWHTLEFNLVVIPGIDNTLDRPIYMLPLDTDSQKTVGGDEDVTLTLKGFPGSSLTVKANSVFDAQGNQVTAEITWTQVNADRVPMTPPMGSQPMLTTAIQPAGLRFEPPAKMCLPNAGLPPGQIVELFGFDHDLGSFVSVGTATVSADGALVCSDEGFGVKKSGWHPVVPPPPPCTPVCSGPPQETECVRYDTTPPAGPCDCPTYTPVYKTGPCDDGNDCTINDRCQNGVCKGDPVTVTNIQGPCVAAIGAAVTYTVNSNAPDKVKWKAVGGTPSEGQGGSFTTTFNAAGDRTVMAYCGTSSQSKSVGVGPAAATVTANLNEVETAEAPGASAFGQVKRKSHSAEYVGVVDGDKWCFRLDVFTEKHTVGVQSLGRTDISGANDPDITPANVCAIIADLTPPAVNAGHGPPRSTYYTHSITLSHENFHVSDFRDKVSTPTMNDLRDYVQQAGHCTDCKSATPTATFDTKMEQLWNMHRPTYFDGNHEVRAHNHSNPQYATLIQAIRNRIANAPAAEGWPTCP